MFNNYSSNTIKINAISGTLVKNYKDSFFLDYDIGSNLADALHSAAPRYYAKGRRCFYSLREEDTEPVVILQTMLISEKRVMSEVIYKSDFDKLFSEVTER